MTQLHEHLEGFEDYSQHLWCEPYVAHAENLHENSVNKLAFNAIDQAIENFMGNTQDVQHYVTEGGAINDNHHEIINQLHELREKSTKLAHEFVLNYYISHDDSMHGIDVKIEFYTLPPDTVKQGPSRGYGDYFFSKMAVVHIDELHCYDFILG